jgi:Arc/MetJ-type ribon-helix-helix transcriptional regulator
MTFSLTPELDRVMQEKLASGLRRTRSEIAQEWLRLLQQKKWFREAQLAEAHGSTERSVMQLDEG